MSELKQLKIEEYDIVSFVLTLTTTGTPTNLKTYTSENKSSIWNEDFDRINRIVK